MCNICVFVVINNTIIVYRTEGAAIDESSNIITSEIFDNKLLNANYYYLLF